MQTPAIRPMTACFTYYPHVPYPLLSRKQCRHPKRSQRNNTERVQAKHQRTAGRTAKRQARQSYLTLPCRSSTASQLRLTKNNSSKVSGSREPPLFFAESPAVENMCSDWAYVAGNANTRRATCARYRNSTALLRRMSSVGVGYARADAVGTVERDGLFRQVCMCVRVDLPRRAAVSQGMKAPATRS